MFSMVLCQLSNAIKKKRVKVIIQEVQAECSCLRENESLIWSHLHNARIYAQEMLSNSHSQIFSVMSMWSLSGIDGTYITSRTSLLVLLHAAVVSLLSPSKCFHFQCVTTLLLYICCMSTSICGPGEMYTFIIVFDSNGYFISLNSHISSGGDLCHFLEGTLCSEWAYINLCI